MNDDADVEALLAAYEGPEPSSAVTQKVLDAARACPNALDESVPVPVRKSALSGSSHVRSTRWGVWAVSVAGVAAAALLFVAFMPSRWSRPRNPNQVAGDGEEKIKERLQELIVPMLEEDFQTRESASREVETYVRSQGQKAFDILSSEVLDGLRKKGEQEAVSRVESIVKRLSAPQIVWSTTTGSSSFSAANPVVAEGVVAQATSDGLSLLDMKSGKLIWKKPWNCRHIQPVIQGGMVYAIEPPNKVSALRLKDGSEVWSVSLAKELEGARVRELDASPAWDRIRRRLLVSTRGGYLIAFTPDGRREWTAGKLERHWTSNGQEYRDGSVISPSASEDGSTIYAGVWMGELAALDGADGSVVWKQEVNGLGYLPPVRFGNRLYISTHVLDGVKQELGEVRSFDAASGKPIWTTNSGEPAICGLPVVLENGSIVVAQGTKNLVGFDVNSGRTLWRVPCERFGYCSPAAQDGLVYAGSGSGELIAVRGHNGGVAWRIDCNALDGSADAPMQAVGGVRTLGAISPTVAGDMLYATSASGWTFALRLPAFRQRAPLNVHK